MLDTGLFTHDWLGRRAEGAQLGRRLGRRARPVRRQRIRPRHVHRRADPAGRARRGGLHRQGARLATASATTRPWPRRWSSCRRTSTSSTSRSAATRSTTRRRWRSPARSTRCASSATWSSPRRATTAPDPPVLARGVQAGARGRRRREEGRRSWQKADFSQLRLVGRRRRARREPAVDVRQGQDAGRRPAPSPIPPTRLDRLRRLGRLGRHVVRVADHRRRCSPARCRATASPPPRTRRRTCCSTSPPAPQPDFPLAVLVDELQP